MKLLLSICTMALLSASAAQAQVELNTYADSKGNLDIQKLTCAQLANTFQEDADFMTVWYSGWYNGLAGYSKLKVDRAKELEHRVIVYCKDNPKTKVITAMDINIKTDAQGTGHQDQRREIAQASHAPLLFKQPKARIVELLKSKERNNGRLKHKAVSKA